MIPARQIEPQNPTNALALTDSNAESKYEIELLEQKLELLKLKEELA